MRVLLATDAFPPVCGGSGWSTYELARGLRARGHDVLIVQPRPHTPRGVRETSYDEFRVDRIRRARAADAVRAQLLQEREAYTTISPNSSRGLIAANASTSSTGST